MQKLRGRFNIDNEFIIEHLARIRATEGISTTKYKQTSGAIPNLKPKRALTGA